MKVATSIGPENSYLLLALLPELTIQEFPGFTMRDRVVHSDGRVRLGGVRVYWEELCYIGKIRRIVHTEVPMGS